MRLKDGAHTHFKGGLLWYIKICFHRKRKLRIIFLTVIAREGTTEAIPQ
jgi:hypothetical protein